MRACGRRQSIFEFIRYAVCKIIVFHFNSQATSILNFGPQSYRVSQKNTPALLNIFNHIFFNLIFLIITSRSEIFFNFEKRASFMGNTVYLHIQDVQFAFSHISYKSSWGKNKKASSIDACMPELGIFRILFFLNIDSISI